MGIKCCPKQKLQREHFFLVEAFAKKAQRVTISCQGSKNTCSQLWDSRDAFYLEDLGVVQVPALCFLLSGEGNPQRGQTQTCFILHYPFPPHAANFPPYHCAWQPEAAQMQDKARLPCSKVLTTLAWPFLQAAPGTAPLVLTFGFLLFFFSSPLLHSVFPKQAGIAE